ncbi:MAG: NHL repeat-containing protein [Verrucomicrobiae bacterium]|nr:NHL repeat-containing protein [Verrucomicrobiae bacterium]
MKNLITALKLFLVAALFAFSTQVATAKAHMVITGNGQHRFEVDNHWAQFPDGNPLGSTHGGVAIDKNGKVYVTTNQDRGIAIFGTDGKYLGSLGEEYAGSHSLQIREEYGVEYLYAAHLSAQRIIKVDLQGKLVMEIKDTPEQPIPETFKGLTGVTVGPDGRIYAVVGYGSNLIHIFSPEGKLLKTFGHKGEGLEDTKTCHGVYIDNRFGEPRLLVADRENRRLKHYDLEGNFIGIHAQFLRRPCSVDIYGDYVAVAELQGRVTIINKDGVPVAFLGDNPDEGQWAQYKTPLENIADGIFTAPHGLCYDKEGNLYVQDWNETGRISFLKRI